MTFKYTFKNGVTHEVTVINKTPLKLKNEWSCDLDFKNISPLLDEYIKKCVPYIYQQLANFVDYSILWIDQQNPKNRTTYYPQKNIDVTIN